MSDKPNNQYFSFADFEDKISKLPEATESVNATQGWVNWGKDNLYPDYLIELTRRSAIHNAIINLKASMIAGNGFINAEWSDETVQFLNNTNNPTDDLQKIYSKVAIDLTIFGGYVLRIIWNKAGTKIADITHIPLETVRIDKNGEEYYVCSDWRKYRKAGFEPIKYPAFDSNHRKGSQILYVKEYNSGSGVYPIPEYTAGITLCELNAEINTFHLSTVQNQFAPSVHISIPYTPKSMEDADEVAGKTKRDFQGARNAGKPVVTFREGLDTDGKTIIEPIQLNDSDKRFKELTTWMRDGIFSAHQITDQSLLGVETPGRLGGRNNLLESLAVFQAQYISVKQRFLEEQLALLGRNNQLRDKILLEKYRINLEPDLPIADLIALLTSVLTDKQKVAALMMKGFSRTKALELVESGSDAAPAPKNNIE